MNNMDLVEIERALKCYYDRYGIIWFDLCDSTFAIRSYEELLLFAKDYSSNIEFLVRTYDDGDSFYMAVAKKDEIEIIYRFLGKEEFENARKQYGESIGLQI